MIKFATVATYESDKVLRNRCAQQGYQAYLEGKSIEECPWRGGMCVFWWLEGFQRKYIGEIVAL